jgi:Uma2 family endonuclease
MATAEQLLTAEQFAKLADPGHPQELVRGVVVDMPPAKPTHGKICTRIQIELGNFVDEHHLGHVFGNDVGVVTQRDPDSVRGADVAFYSFAKVPDGPLPDRYLPVPPDAVFEVMSPSDRWSQMHRKVAEYLDAGVAAVYVLEPAFRTIHSFFADRPGQVFGEQDEFIGSGVLENFRRPVAKFFA